MATALVIENDRTHDVCRLGGWLTDAGLELAVLRPYADDPLPTELSPYAALVVLGGEPRPGGDRAEPAWFAPLESLLRHAVRHRVPTLATGFGAHLIAAAHGGRVEPSPSGPEIGPALVGRRDAADRDPLFAGVPFAPDVVQWHHDEITELPLGAVLLAASPRYPHQAFRLGDRAWATQFHIECDTAMIERWAIEDEAALARLGHGPEELVAACDALMGELEDTWQPFAWRFAALAQGRLAGPLGQPTGDGQPAGGLAAGGLAAGGGRPAGADGPRRQLPLLGQ